MNRRHFIRNGAVLGSFLPALVATGCQNFSLTSAPDEKDAGAGETFPLQEATIEALQEMMRSGQYTSRDLVRLYLARIEEVDRGGLHLNAVIEVNPDAETIATALDEERQKGNVRGPLHGIPFLVKDNIDTGDRMMTTAGSLALEGHRAPADAPLVRQLREAGAVLLGKTNLSEWANFRSTRSSSGWSSRGGQTKNPYIPGRNPCGSSSGSGVAAAANLCAFAIGTETNGSISCPSSVNGVVGLKPTVGLVSRTGIIPISATQDTAGPMTRTVRDAALVISAIARADEQDPATLRRPAALSLDYVSHLDAGALAGKRIGIEKSFLKVHEQVDALLSRALEQMRSKGAEIVEVEFVQKLKGIGEAEYELLQYEFKDGLNRYLSTANAGVGSLADVIAFNRAHAEKVMPFFLQEILEASEARAGLDDSRYTTVRDKVLNTSRSAIDGVMKEFNVDTICGPATGPAWCTDVVNGDAFSGYGMGSGAAMAGYPSITVPLGETHGLPVGLLFVGKPYGEGDLLAIAYAYEQASHNRRAPAFHPDVV